MSKSTLAILIGLIGFFAYIGVVVVLGDFFVHSHWALQFIYYAAVGILWVWPAKRLMYWGAGK
ncbi:MAG: DUF2842 domain-containing protein [Acetobacteraceae bacterium]|nr:DUF2842 domain-containing protein [Acetobacteraceae bacterium]